MGVTDCHVHINPVWEMLPTARAILGTRGPGTEVESYDRSPNAFWPTSIGAVSIGRS